MGVTAYYTITIDDAKIADILASRWKQNSWSDIEFVENNIIRFIAKMFCESGLMVQTSQEFSGACFQCDVQEEGGGETTRTYYLDGIRYPTKRTVVFSTIDQAKLGF